MTVRPPPVVAAPDRTRTRAPIAMAGRTRGPRVRMLLGGPAATGLVLGGAAVVLRHYEVPLLSTATFVAYVALGITLPGTLLWWALRGRRLTLVEDLAVGTALGYAIEVAVYLVARAAGAPRLTPLWAVAVVTTALVLRRLHRARTSSARSAPDSAPPDSAPPDSAPPDSATPVAAERVAAEPDSAAPWWWPWWVAGAASLLVLWSGRAFFRGTGIGASGYPATDPDSMFQLALVGELRHHVPPAVSWLAGEPLHYHWFVHAEIAATTWATGIEADVLLYRLSLLPMLVVFAVLVAAIARRLTGVWWSGPVAVVLTFVAQAPNPYGWPLAWYFDGYGFGVIEDGGLLRPTMWNSPTQTFGGVLAALFVLVVVEVVRHPGPGPARATWILAAVVLAAVMGAKATYVPLFLAGALSVLAVQLLTRRRLAPVLVLTGMVVAALVFAQFVLFGGARQGMAWSWLGTMRHSGVGNTTGLLTSLDPSGSRLLLISAVFGLCWVCLWAGAAGLWRDRTLWRPEVVFLVGMGVAALAALVCFDHPGLSQYFFLESARPYLAVLSVAGFAALVRRGGHDTGAATRGAVGVALVGAVAGGAVVVWLVRLTNRSAPPAYDGTNAAAVGWSIAWPYGVVVVVAVLVGVGLRWSRRRLAFTPGVSVAVFLAFLVGLTLPSGVDRVEQQAVRTPSAWQGVLASVHPVTAGSLEAGRWLRDHSDPSDLVATNAHCRSAPGQRCLVLHFSVAAYTERRVLLESWGNTAEGHSRALRAGVHPAAVGFWDDELLAANDAVFTAPTADGVDLLRRRFGVRWLFVDSTIAVAGDIGAYARWRFASGAIAVYEVDP